MPFHILNVFKKFMSSLLPLNFVIKTSLDSRLNINDDIIQDIEPIMRLALVFIIFIIVVINLCDFTVKN